MRTSIIITLIFAVSSSATFAQIENDDMYFNAKDREKLKEARLSEVAYASERKSSKVRQAEEESNPTDSYSARTVNPEFEARSNSESAAEDNADYFIQDYKYQNSAGLHSWNNDFNDWYGDRWYNSNYYSPSINRWNSPYYGSYYSMYGSPWNNPYYQSAWSSSFSYHWGSSWNYGWGYNSWNCPFNDPYAYYGYGRYGYGPGGWNNYYSSWYGYPTRNVVIINNGGYGEGRRTVTYGKRPTRGSGAITNGDGQNRSRTSYTSSGGRDNSGGRTPSRNEYYNKGWRYTAPSNSTRENSNSGGRTSSSEYNSNRSNNTYTPPQRTYNNNNSNSSYSPSRSSSPSNSGNSGRSYSPPQSSGSNGRTRGSR